MLGSGGVSRSGVCGLVISVSGFPGSDRETSALSDSGGINIGGGLCMTISGDTGGGEQKLVELPLDGKVFLELEKYEKDMYTYVCVGLSLQ